MSTKFSEKRISVIIGGYGSGKTEVAIALARHKRSCHAADVKVSLVDLDIVNPYFRSRDKSVALEAEGIHVIAPEGHLRQADLPALPPGIGAAISNPVEQLVIDVGGDPAGATALGRYAPELHKQGYELFMVINPYRPYTKTARDIMALLHRIESVSRLSVTGLINNGNVMELTCMEEILHGQTVARQVAEMSNLPVKFASCIPDLAAAAEEALMLPVLQLSIEMRPPW